MGTAVARTATGLVSMRRAFTLVELLVVIAIVVVIAALLIPVVSMLRETARAADTTQRLDQIMQGLAGLGGGGKQAADVIHERVIAPHLKLQGFPTGVQKFVVSYETNMRYAVWNNARPALAALDGNYTSAAAPQCLPFPWGQQTLDDTTGQPTGGKTTFALPSMSSTATVELLTLAGIDVDAARWATDRARNRPFNDSWGNPLVLGYSFYQPRRNTTVVVRTMQVGGGLYTAIDDLRNTIYEDLFFTHAEKTYQYTKAVYLVAAAAGPVLAQPLSGSSTPAALAADQQAVWNQATTACEASAWTAEAWSAPPWTGVKQGRAVVSGVKVRSFVAAPVMVK